MFRYEPKFNYPFVDVIESDTCLQTYQLTEFTKELMGYEWVKQFNKWADYALPKQPACYMIGKYKMVAHPSISKAMRDNVKNRRNIEWMAFSGFGIRQRQGGILAVNCSA